MSSRVRRGSAESMSKSTGGRSQAKGKEKIGDPGDDVAASEAAEAVDDLNAGKELQQSDGLSGRKRKKRLSRSGKKRSRKSFNPVLPILMTRKRRGAGPSNVAVEGYNSEANSAADSGVVVRRGGIHYRSNVESTIRELCAIPLRKCHVKSMKKMPFWYFIYSALALHPSQMARMKKDNASITELVKRSNIHQRLHPSGFTFGATTVMPVKGDFGLIFGVRDGELPVLVSNAPIEENGFVNRCFPLKINQLRAGKKAPNYPLTKRRITDAMKVCLESPDEDSVACDDVARLLHLFLLSKLFLPSQNSFVNWHVTKYIVDLDTVCDYDWSKYILDLLHKGLEGGTNLKTSCCAVFLLYWICEISHIVKPTRNAPSFPRFLKWDLSKLKRALVAVSLDGIEEDLVAPLVASVAEIRYIDDDSPCMSRDMVQRSSDSIVNMADSDSASEDGDAVTEQSIQATADIRPLITDTDSEMEQLVPNSPNNDLARPHSNPLDMQWMDPNTDQCPVPIQSQPIPSEEVVFIGTGVPSTSAVELGGSAIVDPVNWTEFFDFAPPSFDLNYDESAQLTVSVGGMGDGVNELNSSEKEKRIGELEGIVQKYEIDVAAMKAEKQRMIDMCGTSAEKESMKNQIKELESKVNGMSAELLECDGARNVLARRVTNKDFEIQKLSMECRKYKDDFEEENDKYMKVAADNVELRKRDEEQKARISGLIVEKDFLALEVERLQACVATYEAGQLIRPAEGTPSGLGRPHGLATSAVYQATQFLSPPTSTNLLQLVSSPNQNTPVASQNFAKGVKYDSTPIRPANLFGNNMPGVLGSAGSNNRSFGRPPSGFTPSKKQLSPALPSGSMITPNPVSSSARMVIYLDSTPPNNTTPKVADIIIYSDSPISETARSDRRTEKAVIRMMNLDQASTDAAVVQVSNSPVKRGDGIRPMLLDRRSHATNILDETAVNWIINKFRVKPAGDPLFSVSMSHAFAEIRLCDLESLINHERINDSTIDTWGLLCIQIARGGDKARPTRHNIGKRPFIFRSSVWQFVARYSEMEKYARAATVLIDCKIGHALRYDNWIFPINTTGGLDPLVNEGDHWCLLNYNLTTSVWTFYNPLRPALIGNDEHLRASSVLIDYVEDRLKAYCTANDHHIALLVRSSEVGAKIDSPQQATGTFDCGIVVCHLIECLVNNSPLGSNSWSIEDGGVYRAKMVKSFHDSILRRR